MLLTTIEALPGKEYEAIGVVQGGTVQTVNVLKDIGSGLRTIVGGEAKKYTEMMEQARALATERMSQQAEALGADAVLGIRYASSAIMQGAAEVLAYGTAVKFR